MNKPFSKRYTELLTIGQKTVFTKKEESLAEEVALDLMKKALQETKKGGGSVYIIGNGGSAATASHIHLELIKNLRIKASAFSDSNLTTSIGNDCSFDEIYKLPLEVMLHPQDLLIALSTSGKSSNILQAVQIARQKGCRVITLSGGLPENPLRQSGNLNIWVPSSDTSLVEITHFLLLHTLVDHMA